MPSWPRSTVVRSVIRSTDPDRLAEVDDVADAVLVLDQHEQAGDAVLDEVLGAEAERDAGDAGAGDQRGEVDAELADHEQHGDHPDEHGDRRRDHGGDRRRPRLLAGVVDRGSVASARPSAERPARPCSVSSATHAVDAPADHPPGEPGDDPGDDEDDDGGERRADEPVGELGQRLVLGGVPDGLADRPGSSPQASASPGRPPVPASGTSAHASEHRRDGRDPGPRYERPGR